MKFTPNPGIDAQRLLLKQQYDLNFNKIRTLPKGSRERASANKIELKLHNQTKKFLAENGLYFASKRRHLFALLESKGCFGDKPDRDKSTESLMSATTGRYSGIVRRANGNLYKYGGSRTPVGAI